MSVQIELQVGQWYRRRDGEIVYCFAKNPVEVIHPYHLCCEDGTFETCTEDGDFCVEADDDDEDIVEHLPDCTGFDWEPPKPVVAPDGWRLLMQGEKISRNDLYFGTGEWRPLLDGRSIAGESWHPDMHYPVARKIDPPKLSYRPFTSNELDALRGKWIVFESGGGINEMQINWIKKYSKGLYSINGYDGKFLFENARFIHDGTPFGVLEQPNAK